MSVVRAPGRLHKPAIISPRKPGWYRVFRGNAQMMYESLPFEYLYHKDRAGITYKTFSDWAKKFFMKTEQQEKWKATFCGRTMDTKLHLV